MELQEKLARAIAEARGGEKAGQIAQKLLHNDGAASLLIGLDPEGVAWVLDDGMRKLERATLLPGESTRLLKYRRAETVFSLREAERWVEAREWTWLHPRYRWLANHG